MLHVDHFSSTITKKGRSKIVEDYDQNSKTTQVDEALLILVSVERQDENNLENVSKRAAEARGPPEVRLRS